MNAIERHVLLLIGENPDSPDVFTDDPAGLEQIRDSITDATQEMVMLTGGYEEEYHVPLVQEQNFYRLLFNRGLFGWVTDAWLSSNSRRLVHTSLARLNALDPRWMRSTGSPTHYVQIGHSVIGLYPKAGSSSDVVRLRCVVIPDRYQTPDEKIKVRKAFKDAVANYAVAEYYASRGDAAEAANHFQLYADTLKDKTLFTQSRKARQLNTRPADHAVGN